jgi:hypothetical protein
MNIHVVTTRLFATPSSGGEICTRRLLQALSAAGHALRLIGRGEAGPGGRSPHAAQADETSIGPLVTPFETLGTAARAATLLRAAATGQALTVQRLAAGGAARQVQAWLRERGRPRPDVLWVDHLQALPWLGRARVDPALPAPAVLMHNIESDIYLEQAAQLTGHGPLQRLRRAVLLREGRLLRQWELRLLQRAAAVACLGDADAQRLRARARQAGIAVPIEALPLFPIDTDPDSAAATLGPHQRIGLIGTWTWLPNRQALLWLRDEVRPRLPPHCRLVLAGSGLDGLAMPPGVTVLGRVPDLATFYRQVDVVGIPSLHGSGVQEKAVEAIGQAKPVVASRHALRGLGDHLPPTVRIADNAADFARLCAQPPAAADRMAVARWSHERQRQYQAVLARCHEAALRRSRPATAAVRLSAPLPHTRVPDDAG